MRADSFIQALLLSLSFASASLAQSPALLSRNIPAPRLKGTSAAPAPDESAMLKATLEKMRVSSAKFTSAEANVTKVAHNALIGEDTRQTGSLYVLRTRDGKTQVGLKTEATAGEPSFTVEYKDGHLRDFNSKTNCFSAITKPGIDSYLSLGFGGGPDELTKAWQITDRGPETLNGTRVEKLELIPRDANVKNNVTRVTLWLDLERDVTLKLIYLSPNDDTNTAVYSNIELNKPVKTAKYVIKGSACK